MDFDMICHINSTVWGPNLSLKKVSFSTVRTNKNLR